MHFIQIISRCTESHFFNTKLPNFADGPEPPTIFVKPNNINVNENVSFYCNVTNDGNPPASEFEWLYSNGTVVTRTTVNNYYFTVTSILQEGSYSCTAINILTIASDGRVERSSKSHNSEYLSINGKQLTCLIT